MTAKHAERIAQAISAQDADTRAVVYGPEPDDEQDSDSIPDYAVWSMPFVLPPTHTVTATYLAGRRLA
jgi:hypothetical protein